MPKFRPTLEKPKAAHKSEPAVSDKDTPKDIQKQFLVILLSHMNTQIFNSAALATLTTSAGVTPHLAAG